MQNTGDYYQRAPRCCPARSGGGNNNNNASGIAGSVRGAELLCCCCSCSTATSAKTPGLLASLGVCVLVLGYTLLGAFAFMALEGGLKSVSDYPCDTTSRFDVLAVARDDIRRAGG